MAQYYVNTVKQANGDNEVHVSTCMYLPSEPNKHYLGLFANCTGAIAEARRLGYNPNGCAYCSTACHTS